MISISESATKKISDLMREEGKSTETHFLRVSVKSGGCSGLSYDMSFDDTLKEGDQVFDESSVKLVTDLKSILYLFGTTLEYTGGLNGKGLHFNNPNASRTCGCGESFSL